MSYVGSNDLFDLIKSMSGNEKRHFRQQASVYERSSGTIYLCLFDLMDDAEEADDNRFREKIGIKNYSVTKFRLYQALLRFLSTINRDENSDHFLREQISHASVLFQKGLKEQAFHILERIVEKAIYQERYGLATEAAEVLLARLGPGHKRDGLLLRIKSMESKRQISDQLRSYALQLESCYLKGGVSSSSCTGEDLISIAHAPVFRDFCSTLPGQRFWHAMIKGYLSLMMGIPEKVILPLQKEWQQLNESGTNSYSSLERTRKNKLALLHLRCAVESDNRTSAVEAIHYLRNTHLDQTDHKMFISLEIQFKLDKGELPVHEDQIQAGMKYLSGSKPITDDVDAELAMQCVRYFLRAGLHGELMTTASRLIQGKDLGSNGHYLQALRLMILSCLNNGDYLLARSFIRTYTRKLSERNRSNGHDLHFLSMARKWCNRKSNYPHSIAEYYLALFREISSESTSVKWGLKDIYFWLNEKSSLRKKLEKVK